MALTAPPSYREPLGPAAPAPSELDALVYRSNLLASDRSIVNFGGGNTSVKMREIDHTGRETTVLWVKGSGSDLATIDRGRLHRSAARRDPAARRARRDDRRGDGRLPRALPARPVDAAPVDRDAPARVRPASPRRPHAPGCDRRDRRYGRRRAACRGVLRRRRGLDPVHPPGLCALEARRRGGRRAPGCNGRPARQARARHLGRDSRRVVRGDARRDQPCGRVRRRAHGGAEAVRRAPRVEPLRARAARRAARRGPAGASRRRVGRRAARSCRSTPRPTVLEFVVRARFAASSPRSAPRAPTTSSTRRRRPVWVEFDPGSEDAAVLRDRLVAAGAGLAASVSSPTSSEYRARRPLHDPSPRVVLIQGVGLVVVGRTLKAAGLARDLYHRAINVMRGVGRARRASSRSTTRSRSRSSTGRSSSTSCRSRRRPASSRAQSR